jgi:hypothetical protein
MGWANGANATPGKDRAAAARLAIRGSGRLRDMPRQTQGECGSCSRQRGGDFQAVKTECRKLGSGQFLEALVAAREIRIASFIEEDCKRHS